MKVTLMLLATCALVFVSLIDEGDTACCYEHRYQKVNFLYYKMRCNDCQAGSPYCGVGRCNAAGCNCDGGCRKGPCKDETIANPQKYVMEEAPKLAEEHNKYQPFG